MNPMGRLVISTPSDRELTMTRSFNAPRDLVFAAWTKPELLRRWLGFHNGWSLAVCEIDLRVGGRYRYVWHGPDRMEMGMGGTYVEVVAPERLVATERFDDAWYPGEGVGTLVLTEEAGRTTLTHTLLYESREARDAVLQSPMEQGVAAGYDQLDRVLAAIADGEEHGG
jgi:uncharacterized protein YndB with AHSA1/START domain